MLIGSSRATILGVCLTRPYRDRKEAANVADRATRSRSRYCFNTCNQTAFKDDTHENGLLG
jgi:hypothetical protein